MTVEEAEAILRRVTYKPGCTFGLVMGDGGSVEGVSMLAAGMQDAYGGEPVTLGFALPTDEYSLRLWTEYDLVETVKRVCAFFERHESAEWLRLDGKHVTDPHPELKK